MGQGGFLTAGVQIGTCLQQVWSSDVHGGGGGGQRGNIPKQDGAQADNPSTHLPPPKKKKKKKRKKVITLIQPNM